MLVEDRFEDLVFWQRARELSRIVMAATGEVPLKRHYELAVQLERTAMAIMGDIAEGWACDQKQDYVNFLHSAISAACSLQSYLYLALDLRCLNQKQFGDLYNRASEIIHTVDAYAGQLQEGKRPSPRRHRPS